MKRLSVKMVAVVVICLVPMVASAAQISLNFAGLFDNSPGLGPGATGAVSGTVTYNTNSPPLTFHDFAAASSTPGLFYDPVNFTNPPALGGLYDTGIQLEGGSNVALFNSANLGNFVDETVLVLVFDDFGFSPLGGEVLGLEFICRSAECEDFEITESIQRWGILDYQVTSYVPIPAAAWLFGSALLGLGVIKRKRA
ncbi:VPLPA-CTERM sorting domain-containing protein [Candidatus Litorirhabdus singularis]|nr:VPLPA-CTERM sorting domain-containing protein [Candidatus Litorirhabdus singularis]